MTSAEEEKLYRRACAILLSDGRVSSTKLQRLLRLGYNSATRLMRRMEREGLIHPQPLMPWAKAKLPPEPYGLIVSR